MEINRCPSRISCLDFLYNNSPRKYLRVTRSKNLSTKYLRIVTITLSKRISIAKKENSTKTTNNTISKSASRIVISDKHGNSPVVKIYES